MADRSWMMGQARVAIRHCLNGDKQTLATQLPHALLFPSMPTLADHSPAQTPQRLALRKKPARHSPRPFLPSLQPHPTDSEHSARTHLSELLQRLALHKEHATAAWRPLLDVDGELVKAVGLPRW